jgi:hypothetical protein
MEQVLNNPEWTKPNAMDEDLNHLLGRIKEHDNRVLRVIINRKEVPVRIVTLYFDRRRTKNEINS